MSELMQKGAMGLSAHLGDGQVPYHSKEGEQRRERSF